MFCPVCSQEQVNDEVRFCSRCGFLLTGVSQIIANGGAFPQISNNNDPNAISPRKKGIKQGALLLFLSFIVVPLLANYYHCRGSRAIFSRRCVYPHICRRYFANALRIFV
jgi:uncharacterized membrane protein YvbJ